MKNRLLTNFINKKDPILKEEFHTNYKKYRSLHSTLMKTSKQAYYDKYFERNWNNIQNTWKGIKSHISLKTVAPNVPTVLSLDNGDTITNPYNIGNTFNDYFASIAETTKKSIKYSHKHFSDYLSNESISTLFLQPTKGLPKGLHLCHLNVNSLLSKIDEIRDIANRIKPAVLGITESKLDSSVTNMEVNING